MKAELIPQNGEPPIPITRDVTLVGRREYCDLVIAHPSLSKRHCVLVRTDGLLVVRDLVSTNGTKVNGQRVMWAALLPNDRLTLGRVKYKVYLGPDDVASPHDRHRHAQEMEPRGRPTPASAPAAIPHDFAGFPPPSMPDQPIHAPDERPAVLAFEDEELEFLDED
jgi:predicted component of type VI protein secretion system